MISYTTNGVLLPNRSSRMVNKLGNTSSRPPSASRKLINHNLIMKVIAENGCAVTRRWHTRSLIEREILKNIADYSPGNPALYHLTLCLVIPHILKRHASQTQWCV